MAKENFNRSKPHVNVGSSSTIISDSSGQLSLEGKPSELAGAQFTLSAPASVSTESFVVGYPFDSEFFVAPTRQRPALSIDYQVDILPIDLQGVSQLQATLALRQDQQYFLASAAHPLGPSESWLSLSASDLKAADFSAVGGGHALPDFGLPFYFGIAVSGQYGGGEGLESLLVDLGIDNINVGILSVPEPSSIVLVAAMGAAILKQRWRRDPSRRGKTTPAS